MHIVSHSIRDPRTSHATFLLACEMNEMFDDCWLACNRLHSSCIELWSGVQQQNCVLVRFARGIPKTFSRPSVLVCHFSRSRFYLCDSLKDQSAWAVSEHNLWWFSANNNVDTLPVTDVCLGCICEASTGCDRSAKCNGDSCGMFQITWVSFTHKAIDYRLLTWMC